MKTVGQIYRNGLAEQIKEGVSDNSSVFLVSYSKLPGTLMNSFRKDLKAAGADVCVSKNRVAKIVLKELGYDDLGGCIEGQTAFVWGSTDSVEISKALVDFTKECEDVIVKGGLLDAKILTEADVKRLSELPSKNVLRSQLLSVISAPITRVLGAMNAKSRDLLSILKQLSEQKEDK
jgi:large subunit ribosomal protein L10